MNTAKDGEFAIIKSQASLNSYKISDKAWIEKTNAIDLKACVSRYCNILRDGDHSCSDYVEPFTFLLFLKTVDEQSKPPHQKHFSVPKG